MSSRLAIHLVLSLPLDKSSQNTIIVNMVQLENRVLMFKSPKFLAKELDNYENIMYAPTVDKYMHCPTHLDNLSLAEYTTFCFGHTTHIKKRKIGQSK